MVQDILAVAGMLVTLVGMMWVFQLDGKKKHV